METPKNICGLHVQQLRIAKDWSQDALAAGCQRIGWDISRAGISKIEAGIRGVSDAEVVLLAKVLDCKLSDILNVKVKECLKIAAARAIPKKQG